MGVFHKAPKQKDAEALYVVEESLAKHFPWVDYDPENKLFLMEDGLSVGIILEIQSCNIESMTKSDLETMHEDLSTYVGSIPQKESPYVVQSYSYFLNSWNEVTEKVIQAVDQKRLKDSRSLERRFLNDMDNHFKMISKEEGLFNDPDVTGGRWGGKITKHRLFITRKISDEKDLDEGLSAEEEMLNTANQLKLNLQGAGVGVEIIGMREFYDWLNEWFNGEAHWQGRASKAVEDRPYPGDEELPFGWDLAELVFTKKPTYKQEDDAWYFKDGKPQSIITVDGFRKVPEVGQLTAERRISNKYHSLLDKLPNGSVFNFTFVVSPSDEVRNFVGIIEESAKGDTPEIRGAKKQAKAAENEIANGNYMWPCVLSVFLKGNDLADLRQKERVASSALIASGMHIIERKNDLIRHHHFITQLPFCYDPLKDTKSRRSRYLFLSQIAKFLPFYGRSVGTGNFNLLFANRGGEPIMLDVLKDRLNNAFGCILGPPGSGKTALINYILYCLTATKRPRLFLIEKGGCFEMLGELLKEYGFTVTSKKITANGDVSMPLFADAIRMIEDEEAKFGSIQTEGENTINISDATSNVDAEDDERDLLGEMELSARMMITGGEEAEEAAFRRHHRFAIRTAIKNAAIKRRSEIRESSNLPESEKIVRPDHVIIAINAIADKEGGEYGHELKMMAKAMGQYTQGLQGNMFNSPGESWPESDVTILDFGLFSSDSYESELCLTYMSLMQRITAIAERDQMTGVPIFVFGDEAHLYLKNRLLAPYTVKIVKMFRKINCWLWLATQNVEDLAGDARKMLTMFEWFVAMSCPKKEVDILSDFLDLTVEQQELIKGCRKERGAYTEGVIIGKSQTCRFRNVPPSIALAIAMSDPEEKKQRADLMKKYGIAEFRAAEKIASKLNKVRTAS